MVAKNLSWDICPGKSYIHFVAFVSSPGCSITCLNECQSKQMFWKRFLVNFISLLLMSLCVCAYVCVGTRFTLTKLDYLALKMGENKTIPTKISELKSWPFFLSALCFFRYNLILTPHKNFFAHKQLQVSILYYLFAMFM